MKLFKFSMQKILDYKEDIQKNESKILKEMKAHHKELTDELDYLIAKYNSYKKRHAQRCIEGIMANQVVVDKSYILSLQNDINIQLNEISRSEMNIEAQIRKLTKIKTEKASIERLKEKEFTEYEFQEQKENEIFINEFVSNTSQKSS